MGYHVLRHGMLFLGGGERPRCPECGSNTFTAEKFDKVECFKAVNYINKIIFTCTICTCVWQIFPGDDDAPEAKPVEIIEPAPEINIVKAKPNETKGR